MQSELALNEALPVGAIDKHATGWWAMIFLILTEASLFVYLLFSYYYLAALPHPTGSFPQGGPPSMKLSLPDTLILLLSSGTAAWAEHAIKRGKQRALCVGLGLTTLLGAIFLVIQGFEWAEKQFGLASSPYSSLYFTVTGFHMAHVAIGVLMLGAVFAWSLMRRFDRIRHSYVSITVLYWHFVDAVWLTIFFTFYITPVLGLKS